MSDLPETYDDSTDADGASMEDIFGGGPQPDSEPEREPDPQPENTTETTETMSEPEPTTDETTGTGAMSGPNEYDPIEIFDLNRHRVNGDETVVILSRFGRGFQAHAMDVDKAGEILEIEIIGDAEDRARAESMCEYWVQNNPKGILGSEGDDEDGSGGFLSSLGFGGDGE